MKLYFAPLACSLASRITLYETGQEAEYVYVDLPAKRTADGVDFGTINPMGQVPALELESGDVLTENTAILQYIADQRPGSGLAPARGLERTRLQQWLGFINSELHTPTLGVMVSKATPPEVKSFAEPKAKARFDFLSAKLGDRAYLMDRFTIADAYLATILIWTRACGPDLAGWPIIRAYHARVLERPAVAKAAGEEFRLYQEEQARRAA
jgi:glutathione S-transferase